MTFKEYCSLIKESPDQVYSPARRKLTWYNKDAVTFGTIHGIKGLSPFFIYANPNARFTHFEMAQNLATALEDIFTNYTHEYGSKIDRELLSKMFYKGIIANKYWNIPPEDAGRISTEIVNSSFLMSKLKSELLYSYLDKFTHGAGTGETEIEADLDDPVRTKLYMNPGRVWRENKVISFWSTQDQLTPEILDNTFRQLKIADKNRYFIDVVNTESLDALEIEETNKKVLPSYKDFKTRKSAPVNTSDEQKRKVQEFMAKQHGVAGAQKAKFGNELPPVGAQRYAQQMPLPVRQQTMTSESYKTP
jgi:hypothetical protein